MTENFSHHKAIAELDDAVAISRIHIRMRYLNDRRSAGVQGLEHLHDLFPLIRVEVAGWLIREDQFRVRDHRPRDADKLLLSAGELPWV